MRSTTASTGEAWLPSPEKRPDFNQPGFKVPLAGVLTSVVVLTGLCCLKLLGQSLAQEGADNRHLPARWNANWVVGHNLLVQLLRPIRRGWSIEKGGKVREPLGAACPNPGPLPNSDAVIEL